MRVTQPNTNEIVFEAPEQMMLQKLTVMRNNVRNNQSLVKRDEISDELTALHQEMNRIRTEYRASATTITQLNDQLRQLVSVLQNATQMVMHYEALLLQVDPTNKTPEEIFCAAIAMANPDPEGDAHLRFQQDMNLLRATLERLEQTARASAHLRNILFSNSPAEGVLPPIAGRITAIADAVEKSEARMQKIGEGTATPFLKLPIAFYEVNKEIIKKKERAEKLQEAADALCEKILSIIGHPVSPSLTRSPHAVASSVSSSPNSFFSSSTSKSGTASATQLDGNDSGYSSDSDSAVSSSPHSVARVHPS